MSAIAAVETACANAGDGAETNSERKSQTALPEFLLLYRKRLSGVPGGGVAHNNASGGVAVNWTSNINTGRIAPVRYSSAE
jgi:hypothetical protein